MEVGGFNHTSKENFDSYLTKLQTICTETMSNEEVKPIQHHGHHHLSNHHPSSVNTTNISNNISTVIGHGANNITMPTSI